MEIFSASNTSWFRRIKDDLNQVLSVNELKSFIQYEQLLDVDDELEKQYNEYIAQLPANFRNDYRRHPNFAVFIITY